jgi:hypothetical protein
VIVRALRFLLPVLVALGATRESTRPLALREGIVAVRAASSEAPLSAERDAPRPTSVFAADGKAPQRAARPADHNALPEVRDPNAPRRAAHARLTGLIAAPAASRSLAIPFYATAPPHQG